jgi:hypothetical protein
MLKALLKCNLQFFAENIQFIAILPKYILNTALNMNQLEFGSSLPCSFRRDIFFIVKKRLIMMDPK